MNDTPRPISRFIAFFEDLTVASLENLADIYAAELYFKDPFNEVHSLDALKRIFLHMYKTLDQPRFVVKECIAQGDQCFLTWHFEFCFKANSTQGPSSTVQTIRGCSHLKFNEQGLVHFHRDYWDAAEELYEKLALLGSLMRWLKKRASS